MPRSLQRRVARLEATRTATDGRYAVHIGDDDFVWWDGQRVPLNEWQRRYPNNTTWQIGFVYSDGDGGDTGSDDA